MGIHHWKVNLCGNGSQAFGPTVEHALTGPTPTKNPEIQDEADEVPLERNQSHPWGKRCTLSRLQNQHADPQPTITDDEMTAHVPSVITGLPASDTRLQQIIEAQEEDPVCREIKTYCSEGWPDKHSVNDAMKPYWSTRGELTVVQNILLKGTRIGIPSSMRLEILDKIHEGHQGIAKCRERAKGSVWWPGLSREIQDLVQQCRTCALHRDNKSEPLIATPLRDRPWQIVATDLF